MHIEQRTQIVKQHAFDLGFQYVGISKAGFLEDEAPRLETWLRQGFQGEMGYMEQHFDKRLDPTKLVEGAKSVVSLMYNYHSPHRQSDPDAPKISQYAYGIDYHFVVKDRLKTLLQRIQQDIGTIEGRCFVDSAPVLERAWARRSGLGWIGKNSMLINPRNGSFFFLAELIIDLELLPDAPIKDYCGRCTRCIDACPTQAILPNRTVNGSQCISYFTIELKKEIPASMAGKFDNWVFGCDVCQQVCPWNRFAQNHQEPQFLPKPELLAWKLSDWYEITEEIFANIFAKSAVKRTKFSGLKRNLAFLQQ
ncbi:MAG: tRNA epoxyqueuosine(34) reductase QueG [Chitinophagales bacterium]|nr:tRNA epoxyqueuosine(34) reductase QueG [Chitinophagales bacterium]